MAGLRVGGAQKQNLVFPVQERARETRRDGPGEYSFQLEPSASLQFELR